MTRHAPAHAYSKMIKYLHFLVLIYEKKLSQRKKEKEAVKGWPLKS